MNWDIKFRGVMGVKVCLCWDTSGRVAGSVWKIRVFRAQAGTSGASGGDTLNPGL